MVFAHGSGSSRHSPRNHYVAAALRRAGLATFLLDLLTPAEALERANVFDIELLASRLLAAATGWWTPPPLQRCRSAISAPDRCGRSTVGGDLPGPRVQAIVSRGGRPDLAEPRLGLVEAPTLLIVGGDDRAVLRLNEQAAALMHCEHTIEIVPGATHLFEEPGTLEAAASVASIGSFSTCPTLGLCPDHPIDEEVDT